MQFPGKNLNLRLVFIIMAAVITLVSLIFTNRLVSQLAHEERNKIAIWAEATRLMATANEEADMSLILNVLESNTTIPVVIVDENDKYIGSKNIDEPKTNVDQFRKKYIARLKHKNQPIEVIIDKNIKGYVYYDNSLLIKELSYFPYVQLGVIALFFLITFWAFAGTKKAEQNQVWVGMSKETAHQLGTPISSLMAWDELLKSRYPDDTLLPEMGKDVQRLKIIAERFSKIGSKPELIAMPLEEAVKGAITYMRNRISTKITITVESSIDSAAEADLNLPLFEWVIENLCKNAVDAMDGAGRITICLKQTAKQYLIDIQDTGKGMTKRMFKKVFNPGFTTKKRGWGLGLSLAKRIIEEYHNGKIVVKQSEVGKGTVFRITLKKKI